MGKPDLVSSIWHSKLISVVECITDQEVMTSLLNTVSNVWRYLIYLLKAFMIHKPTVAKIIRCPFAQEGEFFG